MDGGKIHLREQKGHASGHGRNVSAPVMMQKRLNSHRQGPETQPSVVAMDSTEGPDGGSRDDSEGAAATDQPQPQQHTGFPTNDRNAAFNCRVFIHCSTYNDHKTQKKEKKKEK